jgi:hypothetical protein
VDFEVAQRSSSGESLSAPNEKQTFARRNYISERGKSWKISSSRDGKVFSSFSMLHLDGRREEVGGVLRENALISERN